MKPDFEMRTHNGVPIQGRCEYLTCFQSLVQQGGKQVLYSLSSQRLKQGSVFCLGNHTDHNRFHQLLLEGLCQTLVDHIKTWIDPGFSRMGAQDLGAQTVDGSDPGGIHLIVQGCPKGTFI